MNAHRLIAIVILSIGLLPLASAALAAEATLTVHVDQPGVKISPTLYGIFFEEINRAGEGGLYAEMLQNRSFEDGRGDRDQKPTKIPGWSLLGSHGFKATISLDQSQPLNPHNPTSLRWEIANAGQLHAEVSNDGFKGLALVKGASYDLSFYARCSKGTDGPLAAMLVDPSGFYTEAKLFREIGQQWKQFRCTLTAKETTTSGRLVLASYKPGTYWLDQVSLFPKNTWKGRPNGLRPDLAQMLADMKPSFNRFPGGCYVEGDRLANAFRWKNTIGDPAERPGHWNLWGYRSTDGLGFHEYLQMCEDIGAEPLFVINCGMSHEEQGAQKRSHVPNVDEYVQDALDAIEYADGPADGKWGALRAKAGHPAPFHLRRMEIGNENGGPLYEDRYRLFYDAIKAKYPEMLLVANSPVKSRPMDILDEHYYSSPEFFMENAARYDKYDRKKSPKIYVGEYAVFKDCGQGNLRAAVGEAAFMTGMERNSDIVVMASYAPLFVNCGWRQWNPNAIDFDNSRVYGTPSYHVQKMFSANRGDVVLGLDYKAPEAKRPAKGGPLASFFAVASRVEKSGGVILKVVNAAAAPRDVRISLAGLSGKVKSGTVTVLASADPKDENSLDDPNKVVPKESPLADASLNFSHTFPGNSVSVIRLTVE